MAADAVFTRVTACHFAGGLSRRNRCARLAIVGRWRTRRVSRTLVVLTVALTLLAPVAYRFRGLFSGLSYAESWFFLTDPIFANPAAQPLPPRSQRIFDTSPAVLNAVADRFAERSLRGFELPLWNPYQGLGTPLAAEMNTPVWAPLRALFLYLPGVTDVHASVFFALQVFLAGLGLFLWLRSARVAWPAALVGSAIYLYGGNVLDAFRFTDFGACLFCPFLFWRIERCIARPSALQAATVGAVAALLLVSTHVAAAFLGLVVGALYFLFRSAAWFLAAPGQWARAALTATGFSLALSAVAWLPFLEFVREGWSYKFGIDIYGAAYPANEIAWPGLAGRAFVPAFALVAGAVGLFRASRLRIALAGLGTLAVALLFRPTPLAWLARLPGLAAVQPIYAQFLLVLVVSSLAAIAMDVLVRGRLRSLPLVALAPALVADLCLAVTPRADSDYSPWGWLRVFAALGTTLLFAALAVWPRLGRRIRLPVAAVGLSLVVLEGVPRSDVIVVPEPSFEFSDGGALRFLRARIQRGERVTALSGATDFYSFTIHTPNAGLVTGLSDVRSCQALFVRRSRDLFRMIDSGVGDFPTWLLLHGPGMSPRQLTLLDMLAVRYFLRRPTEAALPGHTCVYQDDSLAVDESPHALGRAFLVHQTRVVSSARAAQEALGADLDVRHVAVLEGENLPPPAPATAAGEEVEIESYAPREVRIRAVVKDAAYLVLSDSYYPGWEATVNGTPARIIAADLALRAVHLAPGEHRVVFRYRPGSARAGLLLGLVATLGFAGLVVFRPRT